MMRLVLLSLFVLGAVAFSPTKQSNKKASSSALSAVDPRKEIGVLPPIGYFEYVVRWHDLLYQHTI